jgi:hypothetical protein
MRRRLRARRVMIVEKKKKAVPPKRSLRELGRRELGGW